MGGSTLEFGMTMLEFLLELWLGWWSKAGLEAYQEDVGVVMAVLSWGNMAVAHGVVCCSSSH